MTNEILKKCNKCNLIKPLSEFYNSKSSKDGKRNDCKICNNLVTKKYYEENIEKIKNLKSQKIYVKCDFSTSIKCVKENLIFKYEYNRNIKRNNGKYRCKYCAINDVHLDNSKYDINYSFFRIIDNEIKAYILGIIAGDGHINKKCEYLEVVANNTDIETLSLIKKHISPNNNILPHSSSDNCSKIIICSKTLCNDICNHLKIKGGKKSNKIVLPDLDEEFLRHFIRGLVDSDGWVGEINEKSKCRRCFYSSTSVKILKEINEMMNNHNINSKIEGIKLMFYGDNAYKFLFFLYDNSNYFLNRKYERFMAWKND